VPVRVLRQEPQRDRIPAYQRIQAAILKRIDNGYLKPGDAVGSERELARIHKVSLMTARHALASLEKEGVVERRRGAGTFVAPPRIHFNRLMSYTEQMASRGLAARSRLICISMVDNEPEIAARLALPLNSRMVKVERLRHAAGEPFALEACYLPAEFAGLTKAPLEQGSLFSILSRDFGLEVAHADEEVDATAADPRTGELLALQREAPLLRIRQVVYATNGKPTSYMLGLYRSDRHTLFIRRFRNGI